MSNRKGFMKHVDTIKGIESDKDTFLKAARLERHESKREPIIDGEMLFVLIFMVIVFGTFALMILKG